MIRLRNWLGKVTEHLLPDVTEIVAHTIRFSVLIVFEIGLLYICLQLPGVPSELRESAGQILYRAFVITVVIFCIGSLAEYTINACAAIRRRIRQTKIGKAALAALAALASLVGYYGIPDRVHLGLREPQRPARVVLSLDRTVTRSADASARFLLPRDAELVDLAFFIPECLKCRYVAILDEGSATEVVSGDKYGNFKFSCSSARLIDGPHYLRIIEVRPRVVDQPDEPRSFVFAFEVVRQ